MGLTRSQFASVARADEKWVENAAAALGRRLRYTPDEARWMGIVRLLAHEFAIPVARAAELADVAVRAPSETRSFTLAVSADGVISAVIDLARYHSTFVAALSAALHHGGPRRRGRPPARRTTRASNAVARAKAHGVDISLLRSALEQPPAVRLARLDASSSFLEALRPRSSAAPRRGRPRRW